MKAKKILFAATSILAVLASCKKGSSLSPSNASLTVVNASANNPSIVATMSDTIVPFYTNVSPISYQSFSEFGQSAGVTPLILVSSTDTSHPLFQGKLDLLAGGVYSFYIIGQFKGIDTLLVRDAVGNYNDSLAGIRFVNLSANTQPISINLQGSPLSQVEVNNLGYKQITNFKTYPAGSGNTSYSFELRDAKSGNLLSTFSWNLTLFKNSTLVICDPQDSSSADLVNVFQVNNF